MRFDKFYHSMIGRFIVDAAIGAVAGYFIFLWRGTVHAPLVSAVITGLTGIMRLRGTWPFQKAA